MRRITPLSWLVLVVLLSSVPFARWYSIAHATEVTGVSTTAMLSAATTGNGTVIGPGFMPRCRESAIYVQWSSGVTAGVVQVESAHDPNFSGTWAPLQTVSWTAASKEDIVQITGIHAAIRTRVSSTIMNGTVNTWIVCN